MKTDEKTTLGFIFMIYLAESYGLGYVKVNEIIRNEKVSLKYLESVVAKIKSTGLIDARKGSAGGYRLARPPENISLLEIYEGLNGPLSAAGVKTTGNPYRQTIEALWEDYNEHLKNYLSGRSLEDIFNQWKKIQSASQARSGPGFYL